MSSIRLIPLKILFVISPTLNRHRPSAFCISRTNILFGIAKYVGSGPDNAAGFSTNRLPRPNAGGLSPSLSCHTFGGGRCAPLPAALALTLRDPYPPSDRSHPPFGLQGCTPTHNPPFQRRTSALACFIVIRALIFDLDSCLAAADEVGESLFVPAFQAIRSASNGEISADQLGAAFADCWRFPFDFIADKYHFSPAMRSAGFAAFSQIEVCQPMHGYGDLGVLAKIPAKLFLVTSGFRCLQESKISALGIAHLFAEVHIDAIDEACPKGKLHAFAEILQTHRLSPKEVLVVGDNPDSEIAAGNRLGMTTIQILRPGVAVSPAATHRIHRLGELSQFI